MTAATLPDAVLTLVQAALSGIEVADGRAVAADRYVVLWADPGLRTAGDVAHTSNLLTYRFKLTYVTAGAQVGRKGVLWLAEKSRTALLDVVPVVTGYVFGPIELESTLPVQLDPDAPTDVMFGVDSFVVSGATA